MNSQSSVSQQSLPPACLSSEPAEVDQQLTTEVELWEPPFDRWLHLADDLLRDWPKGKFRARKI